MADIIFVAVAVAFFGLCVLYVRACEHLVRGGEETADAPVADAGGEARGPVGVVR